MAQTFFADEEMKQQAAAGRHRHRGRRQARLRCTSTTATRCKEQIAFADVILLNKIDLVPAGALDAVEVRIRGMNPIARIRRTQNALVDLDRLLDLGGFDLDRALQVDPEFLEPEYPFEWAGVFQLEPGTYEWRFDEGRRAEHGRGGRCRRRRQRRRARPGSARRGGGLLRAAPPAGPGQPVPLGKRRPALAAGDGPGGLQAADPAARGPTPCSPSTPGRGRAAAWAGRQGQPVKDRHYHHHHHHDEKVTSVGISTPGDLDADKLNDWLRDLLMTQGPDIFRMKGILSIKDEPASLRLPGRSHAVRRPGRSALGRATPAQRAGVHRPQPRPAKA